MTSVLWMCDMNDKRPPEDSPEFIEWLKKAHSKNSKKIFGKDYKPAEFDERGVIFGDIKDLDKSDAELFPDELEEYTPEERRETFRVHDNDKKKSD